MGTENCNKLIELGLLTIDRVWNKLRQIEISITDSRLKSPITEARMRSLSFLSQFFDGIDSNNISSAWTQQADEDNIDRSTLAQLATCRLSFTRLTLKAFYFLQDNSPVNSRESNFW